jgi:hypothetical protein
MAYTILKSFLELIASRPPPQLYVKPRDYDIIEATNEAGEKVIMHIPILSYK